MLNKALSVFHNINQQNIQANVSKQFDRWRQRDKIKLWQINSVNAAHKETSALLRRKHHVPVCGNESSLSGHLGWEQ